MSPVRFTDELEVDVFERPSAMPVQQAFTALHEKKLALVQNADPIRERAQAVGAGRDQARHHHLDDPVYALRRDGRH